MVICELVNVHTIKCFKIHLARCINSCFWYFNDSYQLVKLQVNHIIISVTIIVQLPTKRRVFFVTQFILTPNVTSVRNEFSISHFQIEIPLSCHLSKHARLRAVQKQWDNLYSVSFLGHHAEFRKIDYINFTVCICTWKNAIVEVYNL